MSIFSRMRSVIGTVLKTVLIDPNVNAAQTRIAESRERFSDPLQNKTYQTMSDADIDLVIKAHKIDDLLDYKDSHPDMDSSEWKDWREKYDSV